MRTRDAEAADFHAIRNVARTTWDETYRGIVPVGERANFVERAYSDETLGHRAADGVFLVAEAGGEVVGFADFLPVSGGSGSVELGALYVLPAEQGRGIGTRLLDAGVGRFASAKTLTLWVARDNLVGRRFYGTRGFRVVGGHAWRVGGRDVSELEMTRETGGDRWRATARVREATGHGRSPDEAAWITGQVIESEGGFSR